MLNPLQGNSSLAPLAFFLALSAWLVSGCTRSTKVDGSWAPDAAQNQSFGNIMVIGVSPAYTVRCRFERMMRDSLVAAGARAVTSCSRMTSKDALTRDAVIAVVSELGVDAVLSTRLVDSSIGVKEGGTDEARGEAYYKPIGYGYAGDPYYGYYGLPVTYVEFVAEAPELTITRSVVISSNLYETKSASLVYTLDTVTYDRKSQGDVIDAITDVIAGRLKRDGLLR